MATQTQPTTVQMDDAASDMLDHVATALDDIKETLKRIARAVETAATTSAG